MELIIRGRQGGKTLETIRLCHEQGGYIVAFSHREAHRLWTVAQELGTPVPFPLTPSEWANGSYHGPGVERLWFDNLDLIVAGLSHVPVMAATWTGEAPAQGRRP